MQANFPNRVILVHIDFPASYASHEELAEFKELALSAGAEILQIITGKRTAPQAKFFVGKGKIEEIKQWVDVEDIKLVIFNHDLAPAQERNLEKFLQCRVLDRTGLILDIFAQRARSFVGRLQVELAQLQHLATRLVRGWSHLERQRGGIGVRGPGETQLEVDRRLLRNRIKVIKKRLEKIRVQRAQSRRARKQYELLTISLVGYTNVGKSTIFNALTKASIHVADQLFATLDPTLRRLELPTVGKVILVDTVGFIRHLPHTLVEAFQATLEETKEADLLLHVIDAADQDKRQKIKAVENVLTEIGANKVPKLFVYNKIDLISHEARIDYQESGSPKAVRISATKAQGLELLLRAIKELLSKETEAYEFILRPHEGKLRAKLYELGEVISEIPDKNGTIKIIVKLTKKNYAKLK